VSFVTDERGFTLVELLVGMAISVVVLMGILALVDVSTRSTARVAARVDANQRARTTLQRLIDQLHSTCVAPNVLPIVASANGFETNDNTLIYLEQTGSAVSPTPDEHVVSLSSGALTDRLYPATGGTTPDWTFASSPSSTTTLMTGVGQAKFGDPASAVPLFQYFAYQGAQLSTTPLPTPLSASDASRTVAVTVSFSVAPSSNGASDQNAAATVSDTVVMRLSPASEAATEVNPPCA
jgi:prepilin-type N-terminal cleavage/methylation domain-containing protein